MRVYPAYCFVLFFITAVIHLNAEPDSAVHTASATDLTYQADRLMEAASYEDAAKLYSELLNGATAPEDIAPTRSRLAQALFYGEKYSAVIALFSEEPHLSQMTPSDLLLLSLSYKKVQNMERLMEKILNQLTEPPYKNQSTAAAAWLLRGYRAFEEGQALSQSIDPEQAKNSFYNASIAIDTALNLLSASVEMDQRQRAIAMKYLSLSLLHQEEESALKRSLGIIEQLIADKSLMEVVDTRDEVLYLHGLIYSKIDCAASLSVEKSLNQVILTAGDPTTSDNHPSKAYGDKAQYLLATMALEREDFATAENAFLRLTSLFPLSEHAGDSLFFAALSADAQRRDPSIGRKYRQKIIMEYPQSLHADEAYFTLFSPTEYLQGDRTAIAHLKAMQEKYPHSPFLIHAFYLLGLDHKGLQPAEEGDPISTHSLMAAVDAFHQSETQFVNWVAQGEKNIERVKHFLNIFHRASLERAYTNIAIADASQGAKKQVHLKYGIDLLNDFIGRFDSKNEPLTGLLDGPNTYHPFREEAEYALSHAYFKADDGTAGMRILDNMIKKYKETDTSRGYFLSRAWYDKGQIAMNSEHYQEALECFARAEEAAKGKVLSIDQQLDLWIQVSHCHREMQKFDDAMLMLSKVINEDVVSSLRLKAMYLRAEVYELQGRRELALKQLKAIIGKGGHWAHYATLKLEKDYGL